MTPAGPPYPPHRPEPGTTGRAESLLSSFGALLTAQVIGAGLGLLFWIVVARLVPAGEVGVAAAAISTQTLLGTVMTFGLGTLFISELPLLTGPTQRRLLLRGLGIATVASLVVGAVVALAHPVIGGSLGAALADPFGAVLFTVGVAAAAACVVVDQAGLGLRRSRLQVTRNLIASGLRFPLVTVLLVTGERDAEVLQASWVLPLLLSLAVSWWRLQLPREEGHRPRRRLPGRTTLRHDVGAYGLPALRNHALTVAVSAASQLMPVVAGLVLLGAANASFAIAWQIASFVFLPPFLLATALFAHGAHSSVAAFRQIMRSTVPAGLLLSAVLCLGAWAFGRPVMGVFGGHYADSSVVLLALLVPAGLWMVVKDHLVASWRAQGRFRTGVLLSSVAVVLEVSGATAGGVVGGGVGLCVGWLAATVVEIVVFVPWIREALGGIRFQWPLSREGIRMLRAAGRGEGPAPAASPPPQA